MPPNDSRDRGHEKTGNIFFRSAVDDLDIPYEDLLAVGLALLAQAEKDGIDLDAPDQSSVGRSPNG